MKEYQAKFYNIIRKYFIWTSKPEEIKITEKLMEDNPKDNEFLKIRNIEDFKENIPENIDNIGDTTEEARNYAYGQGSSNIVKHAEKILKHSKEVNN